MSASGQDRPVVWWLYLLACADGRTYTGIALDVEARFRAHVGGKGARFTRANRPVKILGAQPFATRSQALKAEHALKRLRRPAKLSWAARWSSECAPLREQEALDPSAARS